MSDAAAADDVALNEWVHIILSIDSSKCFQFIIIRLKRWNTYGHGVAVAQSDAADGVVVAAVDDAETIKMSKSGMSTSRSYCINVKC